jgi:murein DD-endopeptidase MepM/ murein hydrolase activator NlpD
LYIAGVAVASLVIFTGALSYGLAGRAPTAEAAARTTTKAVAESLAEKTDAVQPKPAAAPAQTDKPVQKVAATTSAVHVVQSGETLSAIARLYQVDVGTIKQANALASDQIRDGQRLTLPGVTPLQRHIVVQGDSLWELAARYGVDMEELLGANPAVDNPGHLQIGQELVVPHRSSAAVSAVASRPAPDPDVSLGGLFTWPVVAPVSSPFGPRWGRNHNGVDLAANQGEPIKAARDGQVLLAGVVTGYGQTVILKHADGTRTLYAHASKLLVKAGQTVKQGQIIAEVGSTGNSTGPHLHFEIIVSDRPRDPLAYLPKR